MRSQALFRDAPVWKAIGALTVPAVFSILVMLLYNMTDIFFIGQLGDAAQVGAVSLVSPAFSLATAVATMVGVGGSAALAKAIGAGEKEKARNLVSLCGWTCLLFGVAAAAVMILLSELLLSVLGATEDMRGFAGQYLRIVAAGSPLMLFTVAFGSILRAEGAVKQGFLGNLRRSRSRRIWSKKVRGWTDSS